MQAPDQPVEALAGCQVDLGVNWQYLGPKTAKLQGLPQFPWGQA